MYKRPRHRTLLERLGQPRRFIQVIAGPRQTGKTTLVQQVLEELDVPAHYASADEPTLKDRAWIEQQWEVARRRLTGPGPKARGVLVLDAGRWRRCRGRSDGVSMSTSIMEAIPAPPR
jgi:predicted AAA+ superfamily ATPase